MTNIEINGLRLAVMAQNKSYDDERSAWRWEDLNEAERYVAEQLCKSALLVIDELKGGE